MSKRPQKRGTPRRATPKARGSRSRALVPVVEAAVVAPAAVERRITEGLILGELGLTEVKFTPAEEQILAEPVPAEKVRIKPDGAPYLPHADYTRWFNRAFGRGGWVLVPVGAAGLANRTVICPYVLFIHSKPAAFAQGEQDYFEGSNRAQSYGDAIESTVASALRRCAKHLGVGLELWDRDWLDQWIRAHAVKVRVRKRDGTVAHQWRRRADAPLPFEQGSAREDEVEGPPVGREDESHRPPAADPITHAQSREPITAKQRQRLVMIIRNSGREEQAVIAWLKRRYQSDGTKGIRRDQYEEVCRLIEAQGALPERGR